MKAAFAMKAQLSAITTLAQKAGEDQQHAVEQSIGVEHPILLHLRQQMSRPLDRARNQVRKQTDEQAVVDKRSRRLEPALVDVDDVGHFLERVERNARRKDDIEERQGMS